MRSAGSSVDAARHGRGRRQADGCRRCLPWTGGAFSAVLLALIAGGVLALGFVVLRLVEPRPVWETPPDGGVTAAKRAAAKISVVRQETVSIRGSDRLRRRGDALAARLARRLLFRAGYWMSGRRTMSSLPVEVLWRFRARTSISSPLRFAAWRGSRRGQSTLAATGLSLTFLADLLGKHLATAGVLTTSQLIERLALAGPVIDQVLQFMRAEGRIEVRSRVGQDAELRFGLTDHGRKEAADALSRSGYVGPAPVPLDDYVEIVAKQSVHAQVITRQAVLDTFQRLRHRRGSARPARPGAQFAPGDVPLRSRGHRQDLHGAPAVEGAQGTRARPVRHFRQRERHRGVRSALSQSAWRSPDRRWPTRLEEGSTHGTCPARGR